MKKTYDCVIIGGGIGGLYAGRSLKRAGKSVAIVEKEKLGGTAIASGALPIKKILDSFKEKNNSFPKDIKYQLLNQWEVELLALDKRVNRQVKDMGIDIFFGDGEFLDEKSFKVNDMVLEGDYFIIASGTSPKSIGGFPIDGDKIITHQEVISLKDIPETIIVLGGNVEGVEIAGLYGELGVKVYLVELEDSILFENDRDLVLPIEKHLKNKGVEIISGDRGKTCRLVGDDIVIVLESGREIIGGKIVSTVLRRPNFPRGIENTKIKIDEQKIIVDESLLTDEKNIFAIGDINGILSMAHIAIGQALKVSNLILKKKEININYETLPRAIYTLPEMAGAGKQEIDLLQKGVKYKLGTYSFQDTWRGWSKRTEGFVKVLLDKDDIILGIWMVGRDVSEYVGLMGLIIKGRYGVDDIIENLMVHPSLSEAILEALIKAKESKRLY